MIITHDPRRRYWANASRGLRRELAATIPSRDLAALHQRQAWRHFAVTGQRVILLGLGSWVLWASTNPLIWIPFVFLQGLIFFNATVLLHEVVHHLVWKRPRLGMETALGRIYGCFTGISATQFTRWHLDHHAGLGDAIQDPKRRYLSPKKNSRIVKLLYFTPALFPIYFRAAAAEIRSYPPALRRRANSERSAAVVMHLALAATLLLLGGVGTMLRVQILPLVFGFPPWFAINRIGQHYRIDPDDPARWGTLVESSRVWDALFLWSNYHLEHHYFPAVPFYNLRRLHRLLQPFYTAKGMRPVGYASLLWGWLVRNQEPHARWNPGT